MIPKNDIEISRTVRDEDFIFCSELMEKSEPWKSLGMTKEISMEYFSSQPVETYIARYSNKPVGFVSIQMNGSLTGFIRRIAVVDEYRSMKVGNYLMDYIEEYIFQFKTNVFLLVSSFNERAIAFYKARGYKQIGIIEDYIIEGKDELIFRKQKDMQYKSF